MAQKSIPRPLVLGLVGPPGAGKSTVAREFAALGCVVSDSDALARAAFEDPSVRAAVIGWWGTADRRAIADRVFLSPADRRRLEALLHPWIARRRAAEFEAAPGGTPALVIDAALLLEAGLGSECDSVVFVDCPLEIRRSRVAATRGWSEDELGRREAAQWPLDRKRAASDFEIRTDCDMATLRRRVGEVLRSALAKRRD